MNIGPRYYTKNNVFKDDHKILETKLNIQQ